MLSLLYPHLRSFLIHDLPWMFDRSNTTDPTSGAETAYPSVASEFTHAF